jgi:hypothetical protein
VPEGVAVSVRVVTPDTAWVVGWTGDQLKKAVHEWVLPCRSLGQTFSVRVEDIERAILEHAANDADVGASDDVDTQVRAELAARARRKAAAR